MKSYHVCATVGIICTALGLLLLNGILFHFEDINWQFAVMVTIVLAVVSMFVIGIGMFYYAVKEYRQVRRRINSQKWPKASGVVTRYPGAIILLIFISLSAFTQKPHIKLDQEFLPKSYLFHGHKTGDSTGKYYTDKYNNTFAVLQSGKLIFVNMITPKGDSCYIWLKHNKKFKL